MTIPLRLRNTYYKQSHIGKELGNCCPSWPTTISKLLASKNKRMDGKGAAVAAAVTPATAVTSEHISHFRTGIYGNRYM